MCGQTGYYGTSSFKVLTDIEYIKTLETNNVDNKNEENYNNVSSINLLNDYINKELTQHEETSYCSLNNLLIDTNIDNLKIDNLGLLDDYDIDI